MTIDWMKPIRVVATDWGQEAIPAEVVSGPSDASYRKVRVLGKHRVWASDDFHDPEWWHFHENGRWIGGDENDIRIENVPEVEVHPVTHLSKDESDALKEQVGGTHYKDMAIQPIEFIFANSLGFCEGNVVKYCTRWRSKGGVEDLKKARHYLDMLIEREEGSE